jgi:hypothetical protein
LVVAVVVTPVATFMIESCAPGTTALAGSTTEPEIVPPTTCAYEGMDPRKPSINMMDAKAMKAFPDLNRIIVDSLCVLALLCGESLHGSRKRPRVLDRNPTQPIDAIIPNVSPSPG